MSYADQVRKAKEERIFRLADGEYTARLVETEFTKSKNGNEMFVFTWKALAAPDQITLDKMVAKGRKLVSRYIVNVDFSFNSMLELLSDVGVDLEGVDSLDDLKTIVWGIENTPPVVIFNLKKQEDNPQYYNLYLKGVEKMVEAVGVVATPVAPAAPKPMAPAPQSTDTSVVTVEGFSLQDLLTAGWSEEQVAEDPTYGALVPKAKPKAAPKPKAPKTPAAPKPKAAPAPKAAANDAGVVKPY